MLWLRLMCGRRPPGDPGLIQRIQTVCESIYTEIQRMVVGNGGHIHTDFLKMRT